MKKYTAGIVLGIIISAAAFVTVGIFNRQANFGKKIIPNSPIRPQKNIIVIKDYEFNSKKLQVKTGETVSWINQDRVKHTVTIDNESLNGPKSAYLGYSEKFTFVFNAPGIYSYHCKPHPYMKGTIIVSN